MNRVSSVCAVGLLALTPSILCPSIVAQEAKAAEATTETAAAKKVVTLLAPKGLYADFAEQVFDPTAVLLGGQMGKPKSFYDLVDKLVTLAEDDEVDEILFDLSAPVTLNQPQLVEIDRCMEKLRKSGKKCWAYLENAGNAQYRIAARCDKILLADMGTVDLHSPALNVMYMRDVLDFLGIQMDVLRCGDFKGAAEPFMLSRMSPHLRDHYLAMLKSMNDDTVARIAQSRGMKSDKVRELQKQRLFTAEVALKEGLVDQLVPWEGREKALATVLGNDDFELEDVLKKKKKSINIMAMMTEMFAPKKSKELKEDSIAVLHLSGAIVDGTGSQPGMMVSGPTVKAIRALTNDEKVLGVVARINSPGGSATASEAIRRALLELANKKPLVFSMGRVAGSGGYWITCIGKSILAEAGTITGSIGVLGYKPNMGPLMRRVGIHEELVALDEAASMMSLGRGWSEIEKEKLQNFMNDVYERFIAQAAASRDMAPEEVRALAGGRVYSGEQAVNNKLIDKIGGLHEAVRMVAKEAGVEEYDVVHRPRVKDPIEALVESLTSAEAGVQMQVPALAGMSDEVRTVLAALPSLQAPLAILRESMNATRPMAWAVMPFEISIR